jgi:hypothetical protein
MNDQLASFHPIAKTVYLSLAPVDGGKYVLGAGTRQRIISDLEALAGTPELRFAVISLVSLAKHLEDAGHKSAAEGVLEVAASATLSLVDLGTMQREAAQEEREKTLTHFAAFCAREMTKVAPKQDAKPKPGSISLASLTAGRPRKI